MEIKEPRIFLNYERHVLKMKEQQINIGSRQHALEHLMKDYQGQLQIGDAFIFYTKTPS